jgi:hypothetical protein
MLTPFLKERLHWQLFAPAFWHLKSLIRRAFEKLVARTEVQGARLLTLEESGLHSLKRWLLPSNLLDPHFSFVQG